MGEVTLGLRQNWKQFSLLVLINAFVGGMIGLERSILPEIAGSDFGMVVKTAILSFITVFGITKAITNYYTGALANKIGRKNLLVIGWLFALPVPLILMYAPNWNWVVFANILLGINQGTTWSSTVVMKIDLVGQKNRGLAMGLNESAGYLAVGGVAFLTGWIASEYGLRPYPFYLGIGFAVIGLLLSWLFVKDTSQHVIAETKQAVNGTVQKLKNIFWETTWKHRGLGSVTQAGLINNLNDGMVWGIFPLLLSMRSFSIEQTGLIVAVYPSVWGLGQLFTGKLADHFNKKNMLFLGMLAQGVALFLMVWTETMTGFIVLSVVLGAGTAMVYPTFLAAIAGFTHPEQRAASIGVFRLWRDLGYAFGAIVTGIIADLWGILPGIMVIAALTFFSAIIILFRMPKQTKQQTQDCISKEEVLALRESGRAIIVDVRNDDEYQKQHIDGAIHVSIDTLEANVQKFSPAEIVVTTCGGGGGRSATAAEKLKALGISSRWLCGGTIGWYQN